MPRENILGQSIDQIYAWSYSEAVAQQLREAIAQAKQGKVVRYDVKVQVANNQFATLDFMLSPIHDADGQIRYLIPAAVDITERKQAESERSQLTLLLAAERQRLQIILDNVLRDLSISIEEAGAVITFDLLPTLKADEHQIKQLFQNLIANGIKFRSENRKPEIHIGVERRDNDWLFCVRDNGIGIESQYIGRIFVIFQRLHNRSKYPGTGIGLAVCRKVVERHNGKIWVESEVGQGTTFYFTLPMQQA